MCIQLASLCPRDRLSIIIIVADLSDCYILKCSVFSNWADIVNDSGQEMQFTISVLYVFVRLVPFLVIIGAARIV